MQCDMTCGGNSAQMCGGRGALSLYQRRNKKRDYVDIYEGHRGGAPSKVDLEVAALKGRFVSVRRPSVVQQDQEGESPDCHKTGQ